MFVYSSLLYEYWYGETLINKEELEAHYEKLQEAFPYTEDSRLDKEFEVCMKRERVEGGREGGREGVEREGVEREEGREGGREGWEGKRGIKM